MILTIARAVAHGAWLVVARSAPPDDPLGPVDQNPDDVRGAACDLLEPDSVCHPAAPPATLAPSNGGGSVATSAGSGLLNVLLWGLLIAAVVALVIVGVRAMQARGAGAGDVEDEADPDDDALEGTVIIDRSREPRGWRDEADDHRAAGRYRDALRCRYRALVGDLARRGLLDEIPGRTTGEERRQLRASAPNAVPFFRDAADLFDGAWYGGLTVAASDDDRFLQLDRDVLANAPALAHRVPRSYEAERV